MDALSPLFALHDRIRAHPVWTVLLCLLVLGGAGAIASRVHLDENVAALLPGGPGSPGEAATLLSEFGALDTLLLDLSLPGGSRDELIAQGDALVARLKATNQFSQLYSGPSQAELVKLGALVLPKRLYLLENPREELEARLSPERLSQSLARLKLSLAAPEAMGLKQLLLADPLGLNTDLLGRLAKQGGELQLDRGHLLSADGTHLLLVGTPARRALDVDASQALMDELGRVSGELKQTTGGRATLRWVGGPRFAAESAAAIRHDISDNFILSTVVMLAVFVLRFRGLRLLVLASVPLVFGVVGGVAAMALLQGHMHGLTLGFGSALVGIAMDYPLHLINSAAAEPGDRAHAYTSTTRAVFQGLCLGFFTTAMGFLALFLSEFPALRELGYFSTIGLVLAFLANFVLVPPLCARLGPRQATPSGMAPRLLRFALPPRAALVTTLVLLALGGGFSRSLVFDGDLRKLDSQNARTLADYDEVLALFRQPSSSSLVVSSGPTLEDALRINDAVARSIEPLKRSGVLSSAMSLAALVPSAETQRQRAEQLRGMDLEAARQKLSAASVAAGFTPEAFTRFWQEVGAVARGEVAPITPEELQGTSLGMLLSRAIRCEGAECRIATTLERRAGSSLEAVSSVLPAGARMVDSEALANRAVAEIPRQIAMLCVLGVFGNLLFLSWVYRSVRQAILTCLPCAVALVLTVGLMSLLGLPVNLVSAGGLVLVFGCGVDYGLFALEGLAGNQPDGVEQLGVLLAAFTTLAGFGTLAIAQNGAMRALGISTGLGTAISAAVALVLLPGLAARWLRPAAQGASKNALTSDVTSE
ncbi:MMPL family transporter [Corallococcus sp. M34]|uniref:MMPL family transporter n=1 Tax=Citreicoccus inhibens TaxID=2849499 RepID=UPI001C22EE85|nr:MMPL family transporter [Citreicoccus inhibens]MBU8897027.1 MMPL family transporter [Citreicoccus inhibens]